MERRKIEFGAGVKAVPQGGHLAGLHPIGPDYFAGLSFQHDQVIARLIEPIQIAACLKRRSQPLTELKIEDFETPYQRRIQLLWRLGEAGQVATLANL